MKQMRVAALRRNIYSLALYLSSVSLDFDDSESSGNNSSLSFREPTPMKLMYDPVEEEETAQNQVNDITAKPPDNNPQEISDLLKNAEQITEFCRLRDDPPCEDGVGGQMECPKQQLQMAQKLRKVIIELIDTEKTYVKDLNCLVTRYLEPLQNESFLSADEVRNQQVDVSLVLFCPFW